MNLVVSSVGIPTANVLREKFGTPFLVGTPVDGYVEKISDARNNKQTSRNQQNNKPKKRRSVIKRLHQKQIAIARRSGKPIPKYLDQEMERKRG